MKKHPRTLSKILSLTMAASLFVPFAGAVEARTTDITIDDASSASYAAYKLLDLTTSLKDPDGHAGGGSHTDDCYNYAYTVSQKYRSVLQAACDKSADADGNSTVDDSEIISYISGLDADGIRKFADSVYSGITSGSLAAEATAADKTFSDMPQGYYLIAQTGAIPDHESRSLVMLDTAGQEDITIEPKDGAPTLTKQVKETNDSTAASAWQDAADADIGDKVEFRLTGTLPSNIGNYGSYKYVFHDTLASGLELVNDGENPITVKLGDTALVADTDYTLTTSGAADGCSLEISIADLVSLAKNKGAQLSADTKVTVEYKATLKDSAAIGAAGNDNTAHLEYSDDPYDTSSTGSTVSDLVTVFTYKLGVNKVDAEGEPLAGANFELQKWNGTEYVAYKTPPENASATQFDFVGLDAGQYKLVETKIPDGYTKADDIEFTVEAAYDTDSADPNLTGLVVKQGGDTVSDPGDPFTVDVSAGMISTTIENVAGIHLPSTGGMGTTLIYSAGFLLIIGGTLYIVLKRRNETAE